MDYFDWPLHNGIPGLRPIPECIENSSMAIIKSKQIQDPRPSCNFTFA